MHTSQNSSFFSLQSKIVNSLQKEMADVAHLFLALSPKQNTMPFIVMIKIVTIYY